MIFCKERIGAEDLKLSTALDHDHFYKNEFEVEKVEHVEPMGSAELVRPRETND